MGILRPISKNDNKKNTFLIVIIKNNMYNINRLNNKINNCEGLFSHF